MLTPGARYDYYKMTPDEDPAYTGENMQKISEGGSPQAGAGVQGSRGGQPVRPVQPRLQGAHV